MIDKSDERILREREFHNHRFGEEDQRSATFKYYSISRNALEKYHQIILNNCAGKKLLEYGCGDGYTSLCWLENGINVTGIDLSEKAVNVSKNLIEKSGLSACFQVMNAEKMSFENSTFDLIVGTGIIHHLDYHRALPELARVLKNEGKAVFNEPMGHNPLINLYRILTPKMRTVDEHPIRIKDIEVFKKYFGSVKTYHYNFLTLLAVPFRRRGFFLSLFKFLNRIDQALFKYSIMRKMSWMVVILLEQPKKSLA